MAQRLTTDPQIDAYVSRVVLEAQHHAPGVAAIIQPLANAVRSAINLSVDRVHVYQRNGQMARTCWITINGRRYVFTYNYSAGLIDLRKGTLQGNLIFQFDNSTAATAIAQQVAAL